MSLINNNNNKKISAKISPTTAIKTKTTINSKVCEFFETRVVYNYNTK